MASSAAPLISAPAYAERREALRTYFDRTARGAWIDLTSDAKVWLKGSDVEQGTWWTDVGRWLEKRSGARRPAPETLGSRRLSVLAEAPGTYVFDK